MHSPLTYMSPLLFYFLWFFFSNLFKLKFLLVGISLVWLFVDMLKLEFQFIINKQNVFWANLFPVHTQICVVMSKFWFSWINLFTGRINESRKNRRFVVCWYINMQIYICMYINLLYLLPVMAKFNATIKVARYHSIIHMQFSNCSLNYEITQFY